MSSQVQFARNYAIQKHGEQKYAHYPYSYHLDKVYEIVVEMNLGEDYEIAAYLHDVIEDCGVSKEEIAKLFNQHIAELVFAVSGFGENRKERQEDMKNKMALYPESINLKMADRLANIRSSKINKPSLYQTYKKEHEKLKELFELGSPELFYLIEQELELLTPSIISNKPKR